MSKLQQITIAAAAAAVWMAGASAEERVYGAIESLDRGKRATETASARVIEPSRSGDEERAGPARPAISWSAEEQTGAPAGAISASAEAMTRLGLSGRQ